MIRSNGANSCERSPITAIWLTKWSAPIADSICWGATYLPPEVLIRSLIRSVIRRFPSVSISPASPVRNQPFTNASAVSRGFW